MTRTFEALVRDQPGVLNRAVSLIRRRGHNIDRLEVGRSDQPGLSRLTVAVDEENVERVIAQLRRLIDVISVNETPNASPRHRTDPWGGRAGPASYHFQGDGADDHVED
jgi:acetolactate synthase small subunit